MSLGSNNLLARGAAWLASRLQDSAADEVTYTRGAETVTLPATLGRSLLKLADGDGGVRMEWTDRDFIISATDLILAGERIEPARGDLIALPGDEGRRHHEVVPYGDEPPWRYADPHRLLIRVHTKFIETEPTC